MSGKKDADIFDLFELHLNSEEDITDTFQDQIEQAVNQVIRERERILEVLLIRVGIDVDAPIQNIVEEMKSKGLSIESNMSQSSNEEVFSVIDQVGQTLEQITLKSVVTYEN